MRKLFVTVFLVLLFLLGLVFGALNLDTVTLNFHLGQIRLPVGIMVILAVLVGAVLGLLVCSGLVLKYRSESRSLQKRISLAEQELTNVRKIPVEG